MDRYYQVLPSPIVNLYIFATAREKEIGAWTDQQEEGSIVIPKIANILMLLPGIQPCYYPT